MKNAIGDSTEEALKKVKTQDKKKKKRYNPTTALTPSVI